MSLLFRVAPNVALKQKPNMSGQLWNLPAVYDSNSSHFGYDAKVRTKSESSRATNFISHRIRPCHIVIPAIYRVHS
jgi:hypothetical protein